MHLEEVHSSQVMEKIPSRRHSVVQEEEHPSSYNIEEILIFFTFNIYEEVSGKRIQSVKQSDGTMKQIQKAKVEKNKAAIERINIIWVKDEEEESSSSSMSMYILDSDKEESNMPSHRSPTIIVHDAPLPMHLEEV